jgi:hypothetical protein
MVRPIRNEIPAAATLPIRIERRRARGRDANLENGRLILSKTFCKEDFFRKPPGMVVTAPGTRARYTFRKSAAAVTNTADKNSPSSVPATPKREVTAADAVEAIPTAKTLGRSKMVCCCEVKKIPPVFQSITHQLLSLEILFIYSLPITGRVTPTAL